MIASNAAASLPDARRNTVPQPVRKERGAVTTSGSASRSPSKNTIRSSFSKTGVAEFVSDLPSQENHSQLTMIIRVDTSGDYSASFVTSESLGLVPLKSLSKQQLTSLAHLLEGLSEEMLSLRGDLERNDSQGSGSGECGCTKHTWMPED